MADKYPIGPAPIPSLEQLRQYLDGSLDAETRARLEAGLNEDPLLADALEGLQALPDAGAAEQRIGRLRAQTRQRLASLEPPERPQRNSRRQSRVKPKLHLNMAMAIAAGLALLLTSAYLFYQLRRPETSAPALTTMTAPTASDQLAMNQESVLQDETAPLPEANSQVPPPQAESLSSRSEVTPPVPPSPEPEPENRPEPTPSPSNSGLLATEIAAEETTAEATDLPEDLEVNLPEVEPAPVQPSAPSVVLSAETEPVEVEAADEAPGRRQATSLQVPGLVGGQQESGTSAASTTSVQAKAGQAKMVTDASGLAMAQSYLDQDQPEQALRLLDQLTGLSGEALAEQQWLVYKAHAAAGHSRRARKQLRHIASQPGPYQAEAQALLESDP